MIGLRICEGAEKCKSREQINEKIRENNMRFAVFVISQEYDRLGYENGKIVTPKLTTFDADIKLDQEKSQEIVIQEEKLYTDHQLYSIGLKQEEHTFYTVSSPTQNRPLS